MMLASAFVAQDGTLNFSSPEAAELIVVKPVNTTGLYCIGAAQWKCGTLSGSPVQVTIQAVSLPYDVPLMALANTGYGSDCNLVPGAGAGAITIQGVNGKPYDAAFSLSIVVQSVG